MSRSLKKGPFVDTPLLEKLEAMNRANEKKVIKSLDHIIKQLKDADSLGTPFLMVNDLVDKIGPHWQKVFQDFRKKLPANTKIIKLPAEDVLRHDIWLHKLLGIPKRRK